MEQYPSDVYRDISIDLETLSLDPRAVVVSIGAVAFNQAGLGASLRLVLDRGWQTNRLHRVSSAATIQWWDGLKGTKAVEVFSEKPMALSAALFELSRFVQELQYATGAVRLWAKGSKDFTWLETLYADMGGGGSVPWHYRNALDYRSLIACTPEPVVHELDATAEGLMDGAGGRIPHEAPNDAQFQAHFLRGLLMVHGYWKLAR